MLSPSLSAAPAKALDANAFPLPITELCRHLERRGIKAWMHGDGLLDAVFDSLGEPRRAAWGRDRKPTHALLCETTGETLLSALPQAVVTTAHQARLTQATEWGPVDLIPLGEASIISSLTAFGYSALAVAYRPEDTRWAEVEGALASTQEGVLDLVPSAVAACDQTNPPESETGSNIFAAAPRRYWIAARLIAEYGLVPSDALLIEAQRAFPEISDLLPLGASARRMVDRVLASAEPGPALAFLRQSGVTPAVFAGASPDNESLIGSLPPVAAVRWAAWLRGSATQRGLIRLRAPHALARRVERVQEAHPLDHAVPSLREASIRRVLNRLEADELDALFVWRRIELASDKRGGDPAESQRAEERLAGLEARIAETRAALARTGTVRTLALDGAGIMHTLKIGPGRQIGLALAHLANFVETHPEENERVALQEELRAWAARNSEKIS